MEDAPRMREGDGVADAQKDPETIGNRGKGSKVLVEALAFDEFHGVEDAAIGERPYIVNRHDAGMLEEGQDARFADEAIGKFAFFPGNFEDFESNAALKHFVFGLVDHAHATASDRSKQTIAGAREVGQIRPVAETG